MYQKIEGGSMRVIQGLECHLPPVGYGTHTETGELSVTDIIKRSNKKEEQFWEEQPMPEDMELWKTEEEERQLTDPDYVHPELFKVMKREWHRRLFGVWFYNNGEAVYLTGAHYFYLNFWRLDIGLPDFRYIDLEYFYFWQCCVEDPKSYGMTEICKRRNGKTYRASCILYETISRSRESHAGIQSKNREDAQEVFQIKLIPAFQSLPFFFKPEFDRSKGDNPKEVLSFFRTSQRGKGAVRREKVKELKSTISFKDAKAKAYDGRKLKRLLLDESGKVEVNVLDRHKVVKYCLMDNRRRVIGKMIVTTTVEQIGVKFGFKELWRQSNQYKRNANGQTSSGLYKFFIPAHRSGDYDRYGNPYEDETLSAILADRKAYENNPEELNDLIRKEPLNEEEAFRISSKQCHFNVNKLNDQLDVLCAIENYKERGDFVWDNAERDTKVRWEKHNRGKFEICWLFEKPEQANNVKRYGSFFEAANGHAFVASCDPFDHDTTEDDRRSNAAAFVMKRNNPFGESDTYNKAFVCKYLARPDMASIFYEDMIKMCTYYGCPILVENNKIGIINYFNTRGYRRFLIHLPNRKEAGIPSTVENKITAVEAMQEYVINHSDKIFFPDLLHDMLEFEIKNTQKFDLTMAALWCVLADLYRAVKRDMSEVQDITQIFKLHKAI